MGLQERQESHFRIIAQVIDYTIYCAHLKQKQHGIRSTENAPRIWVFWGIPVAERVLYGNNSILNWEGLMFIVRPDGSIACETAKEALSLQAEILAKQKPLRFEVVEVEQLGKPASPGQNFATDEDIAFLRKLNDYAGKELDASTMADIVGASSAAGAGSKMAWTCKRLAKDGYRIKDYIRTTRGDDNRPRWHIVKGLQ
jgi:hypothetical protein